MGNRIIKFRVWNTVKGEYVVAHELRGVVGLETEMDPNVFSSLLNVKIEVRA